MPITKRHLHFNDAGAHLFVSLVSFPAFSTGWAPSNATGTVGLCAPHSTIVRIPSGCSQLGVSPMCIQGPIRLIGMDGALRAGGLFPDVFHQRLRPLGQQLLEAEQGGGRETDP